MAKSKIKFLMFLTKPASAVSLQNQNQHQYLFSPGKVNATNRLKSHQNRGFSGPITSVVFEEARNKSNGPGSSSRFDAKEPTSPKISCMGQIKSKKKKKMCKNKIDDASNPLLVKDAIFNPKKKNPFSKAKQGRKISASDSSPAEKTAGKSSEKLPDRAPSLSQMKRFASGRDSFSKFDYSKAQVAPEDLDSEESEEEGEVMIPFSAPILRVRGEFEVGPAPINLQPRTEINLRKRRTMAQPKPLQLKSI